jgi:hypothetical protein
LAFLSCDDLINDPFVKSLLDKKLAEMCPQPEPEPQQG